MGKGDRVKSRTIKSKRRFYGNQHSRKETEQQQQQQPNQQSQQEEQVDSEHSSVHTPIRKTVSSSKIKDVPTDTPKQIDPNITRYRFVNVEILTDIMRMVCCPDCKESGLLHHENFKKKKGFASLLLIKCLQCGFKK